MKATESAIAKCDLNDYDIISDVLGSHKSLVKLYGTAICEIADCDLRDLVKTQMIECAADQYEAFRYMNERGMYECEPAESDKIEACATQFCQCAEKMNG